MTRSLPLAAALMLFASLSPAAELPFYVGTITDKTSKGIYLYRLDTDSGKVTGGELAVESQNPAFLAAHPNGKYLYASNEIKGGSASAFRILPEGKLELINQQPVQGDGTCHIWVDAAGHTALVANYGGGSVAALRIGADGTLSEVSGHQQHTGGSVNPQRQKEPHAHAIYTDPASRFAYACDLGTDKIHIYKLDAEKGTLTPNDPAFAPVAPGSGPRHLAFDPKAAFAYVINEMLNTITVFEHDAARGMLKELQVISTLPEEFDRNNSTAEIFVHPNGRFVYGSNRGHDSIAVFAIGEGGKLRLVEHVSTQGKSPRNFALDPTGKFLIAANVDSGNLVVFRIDPDTGKLVATGQSLTVGAPMCVMFVPKNSGN